MAEDLTRRATLLIEVDIPTGRWSSSEVTEFLKKVAPILDPLVYGELDAPNVRATRQKIAQATSEVEDHRHYNDILHSMYKVGSFFRDCFPDKFWRARVNPDE